MWLETGAHDQGALLGTSGSITAPDPEEGGRLWGLYPPMAP